MHAGADVLLACTCCAYGTLTAVPEGTDRCTRPDLSASFMGPALEGAMVRAAGPLHQGRSTQVRDAVVTNAGNGRTIA